MNYSQLTKQEQLNNIYTLRGDGFLVQKCLEFFKEKCGIASEYDISKFDSENFSADAIIESCEQISFFAQNRLVVVKNVNNVLESDKKKLLEYTKKTNPLCTLIFVDNMSKGVFDFLKAETVDLQLADYELESFVCEVLKQKNKTMDKQDIKELVSCCNKDINKVNLELEKLCAYVGQRAQITLEDIRLLVPLTEEIVVFELTTALGEKNAKKSLKLLYKLMGNIEQNTKLFALMSTTFQRMFFSVISKTMTNLEIANKFGIKEFAITKSKQLAKNFTVGALKDIVYEFCEVEFMIKNGYMTLENALIYIVEYILNR